MSERCSWCGVPVAADEGFRAAEAETDRVAVFCRLEHVVPWIMRGARWEPARVLDDDDVALGVCALCGSQVGPGRVLLVRHRGRHRIGDAFCRVEHLLEWTKRGGRWRAGV